MQIEITIKLDGEENTRLFGFANTDDAGAVDWNEKVYTLIEDMQDFIKDTNLKFTKLNK